MTWVMTVDVSSTLERSIMRRSCKSQRLSPTRRPYAMSWVIRESVTSDASKQTSVSFVPLNHTLTTGWRLETDRLHLQIAVSSVGLSVCRACSHFHFQSTIMTTTRNVSPPPPDTLSMNEGQTKVWVLLPNIRLFREESS